MKKRIALLLFLGALAFFSMPADSIASGRGRLPTVIITRPPYSVLIPETHYVYILPDYEENILFYHGYWYRPFKKSWYRSKGYNGPWKRTEKVPDAIKNLPADYRRIPPGRNRIPHKMLRKNWRKWEEERYWDKEESKAWYKKKKKARKKTVKKTNDAATDGNKVKTEEKPVKD